MLDLSFNLLSGEIPAEAWKLPPLETLYLGHNNLSGAINPEKLNDNECIPLRHLSLNQNKFDKIITTNFVIFSSLKCLNIESNNLSVLSLEF